ncbi:hypothetical protein [Plantactinospora soyae]|uniref:Uncharacterized protein n=1 Tax=Plantactinospora soyae TaxID=1544732 RepID=A0A927MCW4_9ACTN|nr:hypothetical protein [Plantactinospora soyae]MBE1491442.1 hypothetical protein [Plantactinospora soyae]
MLSAVRSLAAGAVLLTALVAGCDNGPAPSTGSPTPTVTTAGPVVDATSTAPARQPHTLVLTATGDARIDSFTYVLDGQATEGRSVRLPWRQSVDVPADGRRHEWSLLVKYRQGDVSLVGIFNGQVLTTSRGSSSGSGTANISGSVLG